MASGMAKDDSSLPVEMGKLEIEPVKHKISDQNPFITSQFKSSLFTKIVSKNNRCICDSEKKGEVTIPIYKKRPCKIIKDPTLNLLKNCTQKDSFTPRIREKSIQPLRRKSLLCCAPHSENIVCALVDNCNQLRISSDLSTHSSIAAQIKESRWWKKRTKEDVSQSKEKNVAGPSCSQQALNPPCDVTIDELASYFETLVHIPKKMSSMAEMMYI